MSSSRQFSGSAGVGSGGSQAQSGMWSYAVPADEVSSTAAANTSLSLRTLVKTNPDTNYRNHSVMPMVTHPLSNRRLLPSPPDPASPSRTRSTVICDRRLAARASPCRVSTPTLQLPAPTDPASKADMAMRVRLRATQTAPGTRINRVESTREGPHTTAKRSSEKAPSALSALSAMPPMTIPTGGYIATSCSRLRFAR